MNINNRGEIMEIKKIVTGYLDENCYILIDNNLFSN